MGRRHGLRPPRVVAQVCQRQGRGADHLHRVVLCRTPDQEARVRLWVALYRELAGEYGFGFVDDPFHERRGRGGQLQTMVFEHAWRAGHYLGNYLGGGQLERCAAGPDRSWRLWWVSPVLMRRSGWNLARCRWVRQGWRVLNGTWGQHWRTPLARSLATVSRYPSWWYRPDDRAWVLGVLGVG